MNIPLAIARAQAIHGIKGAPHGAKGGRPRLDLTDGERAERRREQQRASKLRRKAPGRITTAPPPAKPEYPVKWWGQDKPSELPGRNDPCGCGSGRKFKKCCQPLVMAERRCSVYERAGWQCEW